jgi:Flp pilus assembly protein TadD
MLAQARGDNETALRHLSLAARSPCGRQKACARLAAVYQRLGKEDLAAACSLQAAQPPPDVSWPDPYVRECTSLAVGRQARYQEEVLRPKAKGRGEEGLQSMRQMAQEYPGERVQIALGMMLAEAGKFEEAEPVLRHTLELAPDDVQSHYFLSVALYHQGERALRQGGDREKAMARLREAAEHAALALKLKADYASAHLYRGLCLKQLGRPGEAISSFRMAVQCRPEQPELHLHLGEALAEQGDRTEALECLQQAAQLAPDNPKIRAALERVRNEAKKTP